MDRAERLRDLHGLKSQTSCYGLDSKHEGKGEGPRDRDSEGKSTRFECTILRSGHVTSLMTQAHVGRAAPPLATQT